MGNDSDSIVPAFRHKSLGDRLRGIATELRQETDTQIKVTSRILGAAAQLAQNHDQLIDEVVEMVEEDLDQNEQSETPTTYTSSNLKEQFKSLKEAKAHFSIKANSWDSLASKLNEAHGLPASSEAGVPKGTEKGVLQRLDQIEQKIEALQGSMEQVVELLRKIAQNR